MSGSVHYGEGGRYFALQISQIYLLIQACFKLHFSKHNKEINSTIKAGLHQTLLIIFVQQTYHSTDNAHSITN